MRFYKYLRDLNESAVSKAINLDEPDDTVEYDESELERNMSTLIKAIKALKDKPNPKELDKASLSDLTKNLRAWLTIYKDRFSGSDVAKDAELVIPAGKPKKTMAPIDPYAGTMDVKLAQKSGALPTDPEVVKMMDAKEKKEKEEEDKLRKKQEKEQDKAEKKEKSKKEKK